MIRLITFLAILIGAAWGLTLLAEQPGAMILQWGSQEYRISLMVAAAGLLLVLILGWLSFNLFWWVFRSPRLWRRYKLARRQKKGQHALLQGLLALGTGDGRAAKIYAKRTKLLLGDSTLPLMLQAQAAQLNNDHKQAEALFQNLTTHADAKGFGLRGLFMEAHHQQDYARAQTYAEQALQRDFRAVWAYEALLTLYSLAGEWKKALFLLDQAISRRLEPREQGAQKRSLLLTASALTCAENEPEQALYLAQQALKRNNALVPAITLAARLWGQKGEVAKAANLIEHAWKINPHPDLAAIYVNLRRGDTANDRLKRAFLLQKLNRTSPESSLIVARAAIDAGDFTTARTTLEALILEKASVRACLFMAELEEKTGGAQSQSAMWFARAACAPRDPVWMADGQILTQWVAISPLSGQLGGCLWTHPPESPELSLRARLGFLQNQEEVTHFEPKNLSLALAPPVSSSRGEVLPRASEEAFPPPTEIKSLRQPNAALTPVSSPKMSGEEPVLLLSSPKSEKKPPITADYQNALHPLPNPAAPKTDNGLEIEDERFRPFLPDDPGPKPKKEIKKGWFF